MPNVAQVLKEEIARIAKSVAKTVVAQPKKTSLSNKKTLVGIKKRLAQIEKTLGVIQKALKSANPCQGSIPVSAETRTWLTGRGIKSLRKKMQISQSDFARLVGVSTMAVLRWEQKAGKLTFRGQTQAKILALRGLGVREAAKRLAGMRKKK